jgi:hypothetical protein
MPPHRLVDQPPVRVLSAFPFPKYLTIALDGGKSAAPMSAFAVADTCVDTYRYNSVRHSNFVDSVQHDVIRHGGSVPCCDVLCER